MSTRPAGPAGAAVRTAPTVGGVEGFAAVARRLADATRAAGLAVPAFRSPPRCPETVRSVRRYPGGTVVSVRLRGRPFDAVIADMVEGVVVANRLSGEAALRARTRLAGAVADLTSAGSAAAESSGDLASEQARVVERQTRAA
ncbi:MAG: hypothetical protein ACKOA9_14515 [Actinomycetota bacterium]